MTILPSRYGYVAPVVLVAVCLAVALFPPADKDGNAALFGFVVTTSRNNNNNNKSDNDVVDWHFPKWGDNDNGGGIAMDDLLAFMLASARKLATTVASPKTRSRFPEIPHVLNEQGLWVAFHIRQRSWKTMIDARLLPTEWLMREGWRGLRREYQASPQATAAQWPALTRAIYGSGGSNDDTAAAGIPFLVWYGDYKECNYHNWGNRSIPLWTPAISIHCRYGIPMPNYKSYLASQESRDDWQDIMQQYQTDYPWDNQTKIPKAVWRGSLSAANDDLQSVRWRLCQMATQMNSSVLDVGLVSIPSRHDHLDLSWEAVGGRANVIPQVDFQQYAAIIDVDGNSWSSRFGELLCYNSVVLKVAPEFVEYFYQDLMPWQHYIPVQADLSDLIEMASYAVDPHHAEQIRGIVKRANEWCATTLLKRSLGKAFVDILEAYALLLEQGNPQWQTRWKQYNETIFTHEAFDMRRIQ